jgi:hypothetical protein
MYSVEILTKGLGVCSPASTGLTESVQAISVCVSKATKPTECVVVYPDPVPAARHPSFREIRKAFPAAVLTVVRAQGDGELTVQCDATDADEVLSGVAAAATVQRAWGWDETRLIHVTIVNPNRVFTVDPVFNGESWRMEAPVGA